MVGAQAAEREEEVSLIEEDVVTFKVRQHQVRPSLCYARIHLLDNETVKDVRLFSYYTTLIFALLFYTDAKQKKRLRHPERDRTQRGTTAKL